MQDCLCANIEMHVNVKGMDMMLASGDIWNFTINGEKKTLQVLGGYIKTGPGLDITTSFICMDMSTMATCEIDVKDINDIEHV